MNWQSLITTAIPAFTAVWGVALSGLLVRRHQLNKNRIRMSESLLREFHAYQSVLDHAMRTERVINDATTSRLARELSLDLFAIEAALDRGDVIQARAKLKFSLDELRLLAEESAQLNREQAETSDQALDGAVMDRHNDLSALAATDNGR